MVNRYVWIIALGIFSVGLASSANAQSYQDSEFDPTDPLFIATFGIEKVPVHVKDDTFFVYYDHTNPPNGIEDLLKVSSIYLVEENKSLLIKIENATYLTHMSFLFPDKLINAEDHAFKVLVDDKEIDHEAITHFDTHTNLDIIIQPGTNKIEIVGTYVVPEFGQIAVMVLVVGIISIIIVTRNNTFSLLQNHKLLN